MSNIKISEMAEAESLNDNDLLTIVQSGINKKITKKNAIGDIIQAINNPTYTTTEGTDLTINNTRVGKMKFEYYGDTKQQTYTGVNKIGTLTDFVANDTSAINIIYNTEANTITVKHLTTAAWKGIYKTLTGLTAGATMTISVYATTTTSTGWSLSVRNSGGTVVDETIRNTSGTETHFTFTVPNDGSITIRAYAGYGDVAVNDTATYSKFQLEYGSSVTAYEPYVGGMPSPNPDYPQEVKTVTGENTIDLFGTNIYSTYLENGGISGGTGQNEDLSGRIRSHDYISILEKTYTISCKETGFYTYVYCYGENKNYLGVVGSGWNGLPYTFIPKNNTKYIRFTVKKANNGAISPDEVTEVQINLGTTVLPYKPYKESQSYELNLGVNVVDCSEFNTTTSGGITVTPYWSESGLLFMKSSGTYSSTGYFNIANNIKLQPNIKYTINKSNYSGAQYRLIEYDANNTQLSETFVGQSDVTITSNSNVHHAVLQIVFYTTVTALFYPQITRGTIAKKYQPYFTPIELCDIEEHQEYIYDNGEKWFKHKEVGKIIPTGTETITTRSNTSTTHSKFVIANILPTECAGHFLLRSSHFKVGNANDAAISIDCICSNNTTNYRRYLYFSVNNNIANTTTAFGTWLANNNISVYYVLATPIEEEITEPTLINQLNAIKYGAESYYGQTNIIITSEELQPTLKVQTLDKIGE